MSCKMHEGRNSVAYVTVTVEENESRILGSVISVGN
jgi:hypothetical protein